MTGIAGAAARGGMAALSALILASCDGVFAPDRVEGTYALAAIDGKPLPVVFVGGNIEPNVELSVVFDTLVLGPGGRGRWRMRDVAVTQPGDVVSEFDFELPFRWSQDGLSIVVTTLQCDPKCKVLQDLQFWRGPGGTIVRNFDEVWRWERVPDNTHD